MCHAGSHNQVTCTLTLKQAVFRLSFEEVKSLLFSFFMLFSAGWIFSWTILYHDEYQKKVSVNGPPSQTSVEIDTSLKQIH